MTGLFTRGVDALERSFVGRVALTVVLVGVTLVVYQSLNAHLTPRFDFAVPLDRLIPFLPWTWLVYVSFYVMLPFAAWFGRPGMYRRTLVAVLTANAVCWACFALLPAHYPRPSLDGVHPAWLANALGAMWHDDLPGNTFPSIHVATSLLVGLRLRHERGGRWWVAWSWAIALSTLTVKQHFVVDLVGGVLLALAVNAVFFPPAVEAATEGKAVPPPPGALNVALATGILTLSLGAQWLAAQPDVRLVLVGALGWGLLVLPLYTLLHEAEHQVFHPRAWLNEAFGTVLAACFFGSFTFLRMCHLGHHARNRSDVERFELLEPGDDVRRRRVQFYALYLGGFWATVPMMTVLLACWPSALDAPWLRKNPSAAAMVDGLPKSHRRRMQLEALFALGVQGLGVASFGPSWLLLLVCGGLSWSAQQYVTHAGSPRDVLDGAHNLRTPRLYEAWLLHFNWHLAHHQHPKVPWLYLPSFDDASRARPRYFASFVRFWKGPVDAVHAGLSLTPQSTKTAPTGPTPP